MKRVYGNLHNLNYGWYVSFASLAIFGSCKSVMWRTWKLDRVKASNLSPKDKAEAKERCFETMGDFIAFVNNLEDQWLIR